MTEPTQRAEYVAAVVATWQRKLEACHVSLWQKNEPGCEGWWGEGPVDLTLLAEDAVRAVLAEIKYPEPNDGGEGA